MTFGRAAKHWPLLFLLCLLFVVSPAASASPDGPAGDVPALNVGAAQVDAEGFPTVVVTDRSRALTIDQIAAGQGDVEVTRGRVVAGFGLADYWFGFRLHNDGSDAVTRVISIDDWYHVNVDFYEQTPTGWRETRKGMAYAEPPLSSALRPNVEVRLQPGETRTYYVALRSPIGVWSSGVLVQDPNTFLLANRKLLLGLSLFVGAVLALILYNLFLLAMLRKRIYFYYVATAAMTLLFISNYTGFISFIVQLSPRLSYGIFAFAAACNGAFSILFSRRLLAIDEHFPRLSKVLTGMVWLLFLSAAAVVVALDHSLSLVKVVAGGIAGPLLLVVGVISWRRGVRYAREFVLIYGVFLAGFTMQSMVALGMLPSNLVTRYGFMFGSLFELIGLSVLLAYRIRAIQQEAATATALAQTADAANKAKSKFLATMSHELRTPLNSILGFSDLLRRDPTLSADQREDLGIINRSGTHLLGLINQSLDMAKIESGRTQLDLAPVDLVLLIKDVDLMMRNRAESAGLQLLVDVADDVPRYVICDGQKVRQIIINLVGNSLKFTAEGGVSLRVKTVTEPELQLVIEVEDSGAGIPEDQQKRVFEPFAQLQERAAPGTGLGLSIVREYVRLMGGNVELTSRAGYGSLFRVAIPVETAPAEQVTAAEEACHPVGLAPGQPAWRVLIVDDEPLNRLLLGRMLEEVGFVVAFADNGAQSLTAFGEFRPDFIWMDGRMPEMDGLEATVNIRQRADGVEVKIAALTASVFGDERDKWNQAGIDDFVRKPYRASEIFGCMQRLLGVEYLCTEPSDEQPCPQSLASLKTQLSSLPEAVRTQLARALVIGDSKRLASALSRIRDISPATADALDPYVRQFNYSPVLDALEAL